MIDEYCAWIVSDGVFIFIAESGIIKSIKDTCLNILPINAFSVLFLPFLIPPGSAAFADLGGINFLQLIPNKGERCRFYANC